MELKRMAQAYTSRKGLRMKLGSIEIPCAVTLYPPSHLSLNFISVLPILHSTILHIFFIYVCSL